jgi:uncharacterized protein (TIGR00725 family)
MFDKRRQVAVIGGGQASSKELKLAEEVGRLLARKGVILVCGGLGGIMEAVCRGASAEGGLTIGILPGESRRGVNRYVQIPIVTGIGHARNVAVVKSAQAVIAVGGSYGTLSEIGHALQSGIPVVGLETWALSKKGKANNSVIIAGSATEAVDTALELIEEKVA